jgi:hypothetical protein
MPDPWHGINDPGFWKKPQPAPADNTRVAITDTEAKPKEKAGPIASLSDAKFVPPQSGLKFNDKCPVQVSVKYKEQTPRTRVTFRLFCKYKDKKQDLNKKVDTNETKGIATTELPLYYPDDYSDGSVEYFFTAEHCVGDKAIESGTLKIPSETKTGWVPQITFSKEYSKVNAYNLSLLANLAYEGKDNILNCFDVLQTHSDRTFKSQRIIASPFLVDTDSANCFKIQNEKEDVFNIKETNTQGFLALNDKQIIISIRGTTNLPDWGNNLNAKHVPYSFGPGHVHEGFYKAFLSIKEKISDYFDDNGQNKEIFVTGHSLGGAVATLIAAYLHAEKKSNKIILYTFGSPRVGDRVFAEHFSKAAYFPCFRIVNNNDIVTKVPLPYMDLRPQILLSPVGGPAKLPFVLFNPLDDPFTHIGEFIHIKKVANNETFLSKLQELSFYATLPVNIVNLPGKLTLDAILAVKGGKDDHDMTKCYCPILRSNMKKSIDSYLGSNTDQVEKLEKDVKAIENEITDLENNKMSLKTQSLDPAREHYLTANCDRMIEGRKKYLNEYKNRIAHYKQTEANKPIYLKELICTPTKPEIEKELKFQKQLA